MRRTLIASSFAVAALVGVAGGVTYAVESGSGRDPASPTTTLDIEAVMSVLTPEQLGCLVQNMGSVDAADTAAIFALLEECGISLEQLGDLAVGGGTAPADSVVPASEPAGTPETVDAATVAAVFELFGMDQTTVDCLVSASAAVAPGDEVAAESVFIDCGVGPAQILEGIVALDAAASGDTTTATVAGAPTTALDLAANPIAQVVQEQLAAAGITLTDEQISCLVDNIASYDPSDPSSVLPLLETCGIDVANPDG
jgi:hypothetical protein